MILIKWKYFTLLGLIFYTLSFSVATLVQAEPEYWVYTVTEDDNLWDLTLKYSHIRYWRQIQKFNNIKQPRQIPPGTKIKFPLTWLNLQSARVEVIDVKGEPTVTNKDKLALPIKIGGLLEKGSKLITEKDENALLEFEDDSKILVRENTEIVLDQLLAYNKTGIAYTRISLNRGRTENFVNKTKSSVGTHYQLTTPSAVMAVRGTEYRVSVSEDQNISRSEVLKGLVNTQGAGTSRQIFAGNGTLIKQGEVPSLPVKLLPAPDLSTMNQIAQVVPIRIPFVALEKADAYRIEISADNNFINLLFDGTSKLPIVRSSDLPDGSYWVRIRGIDEFGLEGLNSIHQFELDARPFPPFIILPVEDAVVREKTPLFKWSEAKNVSTYHFQLAKSQDFSRPVINQVGISEFEFRLEKLEPGEYFWHVASIDDLQEQGPYSDTVKFFLKPSPGSPELELPEIGEEEMTLRWKKAAPEQKYHFQLAEDEGFTEIIEDQELEDPFITLPVLSSGTYYVRVGTIDTDGYHGDFGQAQLIDIPISDYWYLLLLLLTPLLILL